MQGGGGGSRVSSTGVTWGGGQMPPIFFFLSKGSFWLLSRRGANKKCSDSGGKGCMMLRAGREHPFKHHYINFLIPMVDFWPLPAYY